jgi:hypothetical protein
MGGFRRPGRGGEGLRRWWLSGLSGGGRGGCNPPPLPSGLLVSEIKPASPGQPGYGRGVVGGGTHARARPRKSAIFALQDGKIPDSPPRGPALRGPRRRGVWGGSPSLPPPLFPGLLGPLEAAVGGLPGEGRTPDPDPAWGPPGRIPFHPREAPLPPPPLAGFMRGSPGILRNSMRAGPRSRPFWGLPLREGELSRKWGTCTFSGGGVREASSP